MKSQEVAKNIFELGKRKTNAESKCNDLNGMPYMDGCDMKISYKKLWILLIEKDISPATLRKDLSIATGTMTKLRKNEEVALSVLLRICQYLHCNIGDICDAVENKQNI